MKSKFKIKGLDCANCASQLEKSIQKLDGINNVSINFITQRMNLEYAKTKKEKILENVIKIIKREEPDVVIEEV